MSRTAFITLLAAMLCVVSAEAQVVRRVLSFPREFVSNVAIDDAGTAIYAVTSTNQFGTNPGYLKQIVRWDPPTGAGTPITDFEEGVESVSVSDDGTWLALVSCADPLGTNHDESAELFVMHPDGTGVAQLTSENLLPLGRRGIRAAVISGSGNRISFIGRVNPLGTNSAYATALFVIDRDGTNLRQLQTNVRLAQEDDFGIGNSGYWPGLGFDISDDGSKVVYITSTQEIAGINSDGTGNHTFGSTTNAADVVISGNGAKIAYVTGPVRTVRARTFDGNTFAVTLGNGEGPSITDDAVTVYFTGASPSGIYKIPSAGGGPATLVAPGLKLVSLAGNGSRIAARGTELLAIDDTGGSQQQLTTTTVPGRPANDITFSSDGVAVRFSSTIDPNGTNPGNDYEQFSFGVGPSQFTQLTDATLPAIDMPGFSDPGDLYFVSPHNLTGQNTCFIGQLFRRSPSGGLSQLSSCGNDGGAALAYPGPRADGVVIAYGGWSPGVLAVVYSDGTGPFQLLPNGPSLISASLRAAGAGETTWITFGRDSWVWRMKGDGSVRQVVSERSQFGIFHTPSISDDGNRVAWQAREIALIDTFPQAFLFDVPTGSRYQLTNTVDPVGFNARVTRNGSWVFAGDGRYDANTRALEPATGFPHLPGQNFDLQPDSTGNRWLIAVYDRLDNSPAYHAFYLADMNGVPSFTIGEASPTVLSWDPSPTSMRYDVIRGSISNLSIAGSTVSLGPVSCLEDDSPDSHTRGYGDPSTPAPGQAFFFLYRGSVGANAVAGSYGQGTGTRERLAGAGGCNP